MISQKKMEEFLSLNEQFEISFIGLPYKNTKQAAVYTYQGYFEMINDRLAHKDMSCFNQTYTRSIKKIIMIKKGNKLLYGKRCRKCGRAVPKKHLNCHYCYSYNIERVL